MNFMRRRFLQASAAIAAGVFARRLRAEAAPAAGEIPRRRFGQSEVMVSAIGLGGFHLGLMKDEAEAVRVVHEAIDAGVSFFDNAWEYNKGVSEERVGKALQGKRDG